MADAPKITPGNKAPDKVEPKIVHKLAVRTLLAILSLGALFFGLTWLLRYFKDPGSYGSVETTNMIAAVEFQKDGQQAVVVKPDGTILKSPDYKPGSTERDLTWQPDGGRVYYVSDRDNQTFQIYRWRPTEGGESEARTLGTRGKSYPSFAPDADPKDPLLIASMGTIQELDPTKRATHQVLPPMMNELPQGTAEEEGGGGSSLFRALYGELGDSFARAQLLPGGTTIAAIMRGSRGDVLVLQDLEPGANGRMKPPQPLAAGDRIDFSISKKGGVLFSVQNFNFPNDAMMKAASVNNVAKVPFRHAILFVEGPGKPWIPIAISQVDEQAYGQPAISPDGDKLLAVIGKYDGTNLVSEGLVTMPVAERGAQSSAHLVNTPTFEPTWDATGRKIAYIKREGGKRAIFTANPDGSEEKNLTGTKGDFSRPLFSPKVAATQ